MEDLTKHPDFPRILLAVDKEIFRRKILTWTTIGIFLLLILMGWAGYQQYSFTHSVGKNYCYACGYYEGKSCKTQYFPDDILKNKELLQQFRLKLGNDNAIKDVASKDLFTDKMNEKINLSSLNLTSTN